MVIGFPLLFLIPVYDRLKLNPTGIWLLRHPWAAKQSQLISSETGESEIRHRSID